MSDCIGCGYCCSKVPCAYGRENEEGGCAEQVFRDGRYWCGIAEEIQKDPSSKWSPAFGAGCCSSLNSVRRKMLDAECPVCGHLKSWGLRVVECSTCGKEKSRA